MINAKILQSNMLIADFMGVKIGVELYSWHPGSTCPIREEHLNYHASWGWLMPVIEKISLIEFDRKFDEQEERDVVWRHHPITFGMLNEDTGRRMFRFSCSGLFEGDTLIEAAYLAVVDFIKWQKEKNQ
jgi:hypothetical protein